MMNDDEFRDLIEQAHLLDELTKHPGWNVLTTFMDRRTRGDKVAVLNGLPDHFDYLKKTGRLIGVQECLDAPKDLASMVARERDKH